MAREYNNNIKLSFHNGWLFCAIKEVPKSYCARLGPKIPYRRMPRNGQWWDGYRLNFARRVVAPRGTVDTAVRHIVISAGAVVQLAPGVPTVSPERQGGERVLGVSLPPQRARGVAIIPGLCCVQWRRLGRRCAKWCRWRRLVLHVASCSGFHSAYPVIALL